MAKNTFLDWDTTAGNNTDIGGIGILGTSAVNNFDDAFRTAMAQLRAGVDGKVVYAAKSGNYTAVANDNAAWHRYTATATVSLTAAATLAANWHYFVQADGGVVTIDPNASETINGATTLVLQSGQAAMIICTGSAFIAVVEGANPGNQGMLYGLTLSNNAGDATNDIDIAAGAACADSSFFIMQLASSLTKRLDAAWAVGTNQGGLDTGSIANVTYHIWLIQRSDTGVVDALFSASATAPTMPTNYDRKRRIGSIRRDLAAIRTFTQIGDDFTWTAPIPAYQQTNPGTAAISIDTFSPTGIVTKAKVTGTINNLAGAVGPVGLVTPLFVTDTAPSSSTTNIGSSASTAGGQLISTAPLEVWTNTSSQIRARISASDANVTLRFSAYGYIDNRGRI